MLFRRCILSLLYVKVCPLLSRYSSFIFAVNLHYYRDTRPFSSLNISNYYHDNRPLSSWYMSIYIRILKLYRRGICLLLSQYSYFLSRYTSITITDASFIFVAYIHSFLQKIPTLAMFETLFIGKTHLGIIVR